MGDPVPHHLGFRQRFRNPVPIPVFTAMLEREPGQVPAHCAILERQYAVGNSRVDDRLRTKNTSGAPGAVHDNRRLRPGCEVTDPVGQLATRHTDPAGDIHVAVFGKGPGIQNHQIVATILHVLERLRLDRGCAEMVFNGLPECLAWHVDPGIEGEAGGLPILHRTGTYPDIPIPQLAEHICRTVTQV